MTAAEASGLSPTSVAKYHVMLHSVFKRAVRDRVILSNPCEGTELPKIAPHKTRILIPEDFDHLGAALPDRYRLLVLTDIETGLRWGELVALRPRHVDFLRRTVSVEQTIVEVSRKHSPTGQRMIVKDYPKDDEFRTLKVSEDLLAELSRHIKRLGLGRDDLLFASTDTAGGNPISRNTFRTKVWHPALDRLASTSTCVSMTCATPTPRDCSPAEPTSRQSWSARGTRRS